MAKIVNKEEKRREIAIKCKNLLLKKGMKVTISELAKSAKIGKGTVYEYFKNKEDMVFEILNILIEEFNNELFLKLNKTKNSFEKLLVFFEFFYEDYFELQEIYKEFLAITLTSSNEEMKNYATKIKTQYYSILEDILNEGIKNKELKKKALKYKKIIYNMCEGLFIESEVTNLIKDKENEFKNEIKLIYKLLKKDK